ncbi:MAG: hypothetical protein Q9216_004585 [Gyalolechia sp. 2 TL-2023]
MALGRKYATLPDFDVAPDIYETPELTDDASTALGSSALQSDSRASSTTGLEDEDTAIDRQRIDPDKARNSFVNNDIKEASHGWIGSKRAGYKSTRRRVPHGDNIAQSADGSDSEDEESLERKITRLRREVSEVKEAFEKRSVETQRKNEGAEKSEAGKNDEVEPLVTVDSLHHVLENIEQSQRLDQDDPSYRLLRRLDGAYQQSDEDPIPSTKTANEDGQPTDHMFSTLGYDNAHTLSKVSDFDKRLRLLETALGLESVSLPTQERNASRAVIPVLDSLDRQVSTISLTESSLDKIGRQIRQMTYESEKLVEARKAAAAAQPPSHQSSGDRSRASVTKAVGRSNEDKEDVDQTSKINALYGTLSTIESLSPLLPSVLDRLRSLRVIHADAALASESLSEVESRQAAMAEDLKEWKDGLDKVESAMRAGETSMKENMGAIDGWVKDLETRLRKTSIDNA